MCLQDWVEAGTGAWAEAWAGLAYLATQPKPVTLMLIRGITAFLGSFPVLRYFYKLYMYHTFYIFDVLFCNKAELKSALYAMCW